MFKQRLAIFFAVSACLPFAATVSAHNDESVESLRREIETLKQRLQQVEQELVRSAGITEEPVTPKAQSATQSTAQKATESTEPPVHIGGALRFNLVHKDFSQASKSKYGETGLDVFRLNVDGEIDNVLVSAEYRFYSYMHTLHHGWIGYEFADESQIHFGVNRVPFGLQPYPAHNAWFGVPYYVGLGDDYDMGIKYQRQDGPWAWQAAFYKNEELNDATDAERYSFDLVRSNDQQNEEINQFNFRTTYTFGLGSDCENELGLSLLSGKVYNAVTDDKGDHHAAALHVDSRCGRWNFQLKGASYQYEPENPAGLSNNTVQVGAFAGTYLIASEADILVANVAYNFTPPWENIDSLTCYNDYSRLYKNMPNALDSQINTLGCAIGIGPLFTYVDYILANNMAYFDNGSMAAGGEDEWHSRFNVNVGFYW